METSRLFSSQHRRSGFTLVELLVVVTIIAVLTTITIVSINVGVSRDRVRAGGRQIQSMLAGARDRAIYAKEVRGVRLILSSGNNHSAVALQYVGAPDRLVDPSATMPTADSISLTGATQLETQGLLTVGSQIEIPSGSGNFNTIASRVQTINSTANSVRLARSNPFVPAASTTISVTLSLAPIPLAGTEPIPLPAGVAIDLDGSKVPKNWQPPNSNSDLSYSQTMDILFNPRGNITGDSARVGVLNFLIGDVGDIEFARTLPGRLRLSNPSTTQWSVQNTPFVPENPTTGGPATTVKRDQVVVSVNARTGNVSVHPVNQTPAGVSQTVPSAANDPFLFAETGEVSNQ